MAFQDAFDSIKEGIGDLSQLNVRTFTGEIEVAVTSLPGRGVDLATFLSTATGVNDVKVVGLTDMKIDGDVDQFISSGPFASAIAAHNSAITAGQRSRQAMFEMFVDAIKTGIKGVTQ